MYVVGDELGAVGAANGSLWTLVSEVWGLMMMMNSDLFLKF